MSDDHASQEQTDGTCTEQLLHDGSLDLVALPHSDELAHAPQMEVKVEPAAPGFQSDPGLSQMIVTWTA